MPDDSPTRPERIGLLPLLPLLGLLLTSAVAAQDAESTDPTQLQEPQPDHSLLIPAPLKEFLWSVPERPLYRVEILVFQWKSPNLGGETLQPVPRPEVDFRLLRLTGSSPPILGQLALPGQWSVPISNIQWPDWKALTDELEQQRRLPSSQPLTGIAPLPCRSERTIRRAPGHRLACPPADPILSTSPALAGPPIPGPNPPFPLATPAPTVPRPSAVARAPAAARPIAPIAEQLPATRAPGGTAKQLPTEPASAPADAAEQLLPQAPVAGSPPAAPENLTPPATSAAVELPTALPGQAKRIEVKPVWPPAGANQFFRPLDLGRSPGLLQQIRQRIQASRSTQVLMNLGWVQPVGEDAQSPRLQILLLDEEGNPLLQGMFWPWQKRFLHLQADLRLQRWEQTKFENDKALAEEVDLPAADTAEKPELLAKGTGETADLLPPASQDQAALPDRQPESPDSTPLPAFITEALPEPASNELLRLLQQLSTPSQLPPRGGTWAQWLYSVPPPQPDQPPDQQTTPKTAIDNLAAGNGNSRAIGEEGQETQPRTMIYFPMSPLYEVAVQLWRLPEKEAEVAIEPRLPPLSPLQGPPPPPPTAAERVPILFDIPDYRAPPPKPVSLFQVPQWPPGMAAVRQPLPDGIHWPANFVYHHRLADGGFTLSWRRLVAPPALDRMLRRLAATRSTIQPYQVVESFSIQEERKVESSEIHHFDHPMFGLVAVIEELSPEEYRELLQQQGLKVIAPAISLNP